MGDNLLYKCIDEGSSYSGMQTYPGKDKEEENRMSTSLKKKKVIVVQ